MVLEDAIRFKEPVNSHVVYGYFRGGDEGLRGFRVAELIGNYAREAAVIFYPSGNAAAYFMRYKVYEKIGFPQMDRRLSRVEVIPVLLEEIASEINLRIARLADMGFLGAEGLRKEREKTSQMYDISPDPESVASEIFIQLLNRLRPETIDTTQRKIPSFFQWV